MKVFFFSFFFTKMKLSRQMGEVNVRKDKSDIQSKSRIKTRKEEM